jgi:hypothetical protein
VDIRGSPHLFPFKSIFCPYSEHTKVQFRMNNGNMALIIFFVFA